jgi:hypothetical protein
VSYGNKQVAFRISLEKSESNSFVDKHSFNKYSLNLNNKYKNESTVREHGSSDERGGNPEIRVIEPP